MSSSDHPFSVVWLTSFHHLPKAIGRCMERQQFILLKPNHSVLPKSALQKNSSTQKILIWVIPTLFAQNNPTKVIFCTRGTFDLRAKKLAHLKVSGISYTKFTHPEMYSHFHLSVITTYGSDHFLNLRSYILYSWTETSLQLKSWPLYCMKDWFQDDPDPSPLTDLHIWQCKSKFCCNLII